MIQIKILRPATAALCYYMSDNMYENILKTTLGSYKGEGAKVFFFFRLEYEDYSEFFSFDSPSSDIIIYIIYATLYTYVYF